MKTIYTLLTALILTSCTSQRLVTGGIKKEPKVYLGGVAFLTLSTILLLSIKFKEN